MWYIWLIAAGIFFIVEIITVGFLVFWLGVSALLAMVVSLFTDNLFIQTLVFVISSCILIPLTKPLVNKFISKDDDVKTGATNIIETATKALESSNHTDRASKAGLNILNGFINGMNDKDGRVWNKAYSIGRTAVDAINKATDEHSPSKETFKTGKFFDQGFINGIKSLEDKIYSETYGVGDKARLGLGRAIRGVSNLISEGIDDEFTIRPVLDLSEVQSGAAAINGMLGVPSVGVAANLNAIINIITKKIIKYNISFLLLIF